MHAHHILHHIVIAIAFAAAGAAIAIAVEHDHQPGVTIHVSKPVARPIAGIGR